MTTCKAPVAFEITNQFSRDLPRALLASVLITDQKTAPSIPTQLHALLWPKHPRIQHLSSILCLRTLLISILILLTFREINQELNLMTTSKLSFPQCSFPKMTLPANKQRKRLFTLGAQIIALIEMPFGEFITL